MKIRKEPEAMTRIHLPQRGYDAQGALCGSPADRANVSVRVDRVTCVGCLSAALDRARADHRRTLETITRRIAGLASSTGDTVLS